MKTNWMENNNWISTITDNAQPLFFILGPCVIEKEDHSLRMAEEIKKIAEKVKFNFIFKSSFDKANRTALENYRGVGMDKGLRILERIRNEFEVPVITDIHEPHQAQPVADVVDVLQLPAFLCRQTNLLAAAGKTGKVVNVKKGQFVSADKMDLVVKKISAHGDGPVWVCERGYTFGYNNLVVDARNFPILKRTGNPVVFDATHSVQRPSGLGDTSGGDREFVSTLAASAVVQGIAGVFMEVHDEPEKALCDGPNMVRLSQLEGLTRYLVELDAWSKQNPVPKIS